VTGPPEKPVAIVVVPANRLGEVTGLAAGARIVGYGTADEAVAALGAAAGPAVLWSDGIAADRLEEAAGAVRGRSGAVIEVRGEGWDGETFSPLSAACRGVISGFGAAGVSEALRLLASMAA
jgi:hypothetical protein